MIYKILNKLILIISNKQ